MADESQQWREMLDREGPALLLLARQWSATPADAEDAVQDGFVRFWRSRSRARDQRAYLYACVRTAAMDIGRGERRRERRHTRIASGRGQLDDAAFESQPESAERHAAIQAALNRLPGDQREVVVLKIWAEMTFSEIAAALRISINTAASRYRYAMEKLKLEFPQEVAHD